MRGARTAALELGRFAARVQPGGRDQHHGAYSGRGQTINDAATPNAQSGKNPAAHNGPDQAQDYIAKTTEAGAPAQLARKPPRQQADARARAVFCRPASLEAGHFPIKIQPIQEWLIDTPQN